MAELKKELKVAALENGTVIDHIPSDKLFKVVEILNLSELDKAITIGNNFTSKQIGKKGIIKIADYFNISVDYLIGRTENPKMNR